MYKHQFQAKSGCVKAVQICVFGSLCVKAWEKGLRKESGCPGAFLYSETWDLGGGFAQQLQHDKASRANSRTRRQTDRLTGSQKSPRNFDSSCSQLSISHAGNPAQSLSHVPGQVTAANATTCFIFKGYGARGQKQNALIANCWRGGTDRGRQIESEIFFFTQENVKQNTLGLEKKNRTDHKVKSCQIVQTSYQCY